MVDSSVDPESSTISESNVTIASSHQDDCNALNSSETMPSEFATQAPAKSVPTLGVWAKPLLFKLPAIPPEPSTPRDYDPAIVGNYNRSTCTLQPPIEKLPPPELKSDATLTYRLDGTPQIFIPSKVLKLSPENKDEYIIGKFHRYSLPPDGLVHAVANRIWKRSCKITCKKIGDSSYMFHIPHEPTHHWVVQRGVWHIDYCLLFVLPWTPEDSFKITEFSTLPVWATLKNIPDCCYFRLGISHVASGLGEPILTHKPRVDPTTMDDAKVLVEMELDRDFSKIIALDDKQGNIFLVTVEYTWIPSMYERCENLGHKVKRCLLTSKSVHDTTLQAQTNEVSSDIPVVNIDVILQNGNALTTPSPPVHPEVNPKIR
ncbi:hypothetical protein Bca101_081375 [Brassica carinata]